MDWREYWNGKTTIYANLRHKQVHYRGIADDILRLIDEYAPQRSVVVLDYGCGEALSAALIASRCERLYLVDSAATVVAGLRQRFAAVLNITPLDAGAQGAIAAASLDLVIANSVAQYMTRAELQVALDRWSAQLKPGGRLVLADIIPHHASAVTDAIALLRLARRGGFLLPAIVALVRTVFSDYPRLRDRLGLSRYDERELGSMIAAAGFEPALAHSNLGHNPARLCVVGRRA